MQWVAAADWEKGQGQKTRIPSKRRPAKQGAPPHEGDLNGTTVPDPEIQWPGRQKVDESLRVEHFVRPAKRPATVGSAATIGLETGGRPGGIGFADGIGRSQE